MCDINETRSRIVDRQETFFVVLSVLVNEKKNKINKSRAS